MSMVFGQNLYGTILAEKETIECVYVQADILVLFRNMRVYSTEGKMKCLHTVSKISVPNKVIQLSYTHTTYTSCVYIIDPHPPAPWYQSGGVSQFKMWLDEGLSSFFRRLAFTPEGSLLIAPGEACLLPPLPRLSFTRNAFSGCGYGFEMPEYHYEMCVCVCVCAAGRFEGESVRNTTYIFARSNLTK